jgi:tripartite-type tricarboxylate transporter receptor subunit TctC
MALMRSPQLVATLILAFALTACRGRDAAFPTKPVELVISFPAGGSTDLMLRPLADAASSTLGQQVVVVNKPGGSGTIGAGEVARAKADGYTLLAMLAGPGATQPHQGDVPYTMEDFDVLMQVFRNPLFLATRGDAPWKSTKEFADDAKRRPGEINFGATPVGGVPHLVMEMLGRAGGFKVTTVPFPGAAPAMTALLGGHIDAVSVHPGDVAAYMGDGKVRLLGVYETERLKEFPDIPTMREQGFDVVGYVWGGLVVPKETPKATHDKLHDAFQKGLESQQVKEAWATLRISPSYAPADEFVQLWKSDFERYGELIQELKQAGVLQS